MSMIVYHLDDESVAQSTEFSDTELSKATEFMSYLRKKGFRHVTYSSEHSEHVGKTGVDSVTDGKTPDGVEYTWTKQDRAGRIKHSVRVQWEAELAAKNV